MALPTLDQVNRLTQRGDLRSAIRDLTSASEDVGQRIGELRERLAGLETTGGGPPTTQTQRQREAIEQQINQLVDTLSGYTRALTRARERYENFNFGNPDSVAREPTQAQSYLTGDPLETRFGGRQPSPGEAPGTGDTGGTGGGGEAPTLTGATPQQGPQETRDWIVENYPALAWMANEPEILDLFTNAQNNQWSSNKFKAELLNTNWWQSNSSSARNWEKLANTDPATAEARKRRQESIIWDAAQRLGVDPDVSLVRDVAERSLKFGWNEQQIRDTLVAQVNFDAPLRGAAAVTRNGLKSLAGQFGVPKSDGSLDDWAKKILAQEIDAEGFQAYLQEQAKSMYPALAGAIDRGVSVRQYADPYLQVAAQDLGVNPEDIDLTDTKWQRLLQQRDKDGNLIPMTIHEARQEIRSNPEFGFQFSKTARDQAFQFSRSLAETFGAV